MNETERTKHRRRFFPRFSLRTLLLFVLLAASGFGLWWKWEPWTVVQRLGGHVERINDASWSPDGNLMLTYSRSGSPFVSEKIDTNETVVWDASTGTRLSRILFGQNMGGSGFDYARFTADSRWVIVSYGHSGTVEAIFDARTGEPLLPSSPKDPPRSVRFMPYGTRLLIEYEKHSPELWDLAKRERHCVFEGLDQGVEYGIFSPDGARVAFAYFSHGEPMVAVFDTANGRRLRTLDMHLNWPFAFSSDGRNLIATLEKPLIEFANTRDDRVRLDPASQRTCVVDLATGKAVRVLDEELYSEPALPGGGRLLFAGESHIDLCDPSTLERKGRISCNPDGRISMTEDGKRILYEPGNTSRMKNDGTAILCFAEWDVDAKKELYRVEVPLFPTEVLISAPYVKQDRRLVAVTTRKTVAWDAGTGANLEKIFERGIPSSDGRRVLLWSDGVDLRIGDLYRGEILAELKGTASGMMPKASFSPSGDRLLLVPGGSAEEAQLWERRRDEGPWGIVALPEFWLTMLFALLLLWSLVRDFRTLRRAPA